eukprot:972478-Amorphochlora_amoeboformis.AAC.1
MQTCRNMKTNRQSSQTPASNDARPSESASGECLFGVYTWQSTCRIVSGRIYFFASIENRLESFVQIKLISSETPPMQRRFQMFTRWINLANIRISRYGNVGEPPSSGRRGMPWIFGRSPKESPRISRSPGAVR